MAATPAALPPLPTAPVAKRMKSAAQPGEMLVVAGWGKIGPSGQWSPHIRKAAVPYLPQPGCNQAMSEAGGGPVPDTHFCAGLGAGRQDTCGGDSGGPALIKRLGQPDMLVGITSFGPTDLCGFPGKNIGALLASPACDSSAC